MQEEDFVLFDDEEDSGEEGGFEVDNDTLNFMFEPSYNNKILDDLNDKQKEAVTYIDGPILVLAGAGSGKTRVLTRRVANLVLNHHIQPYQILAVTFTNKATAEMKDRLSALLGGQVNDLWVHTFHAMSVRILRRHADRLGFTTSFTIYDANESLSVIKNILKELKIDAKKWTPQSFRSEISKAKNNMQLPNEYYEEARKNVTHCYSDYLSHLEDTKKVYTKYIEALKTQNAMDFDDLLINTFRLLRDFEDIRESYRKKFLYILVDEFQDTNEVQYEMIRLLSNDKKNVFVVGDDDQSIYAFRGAKPSNINSFERDFPNTRVVKLEQNYRSTGNILSVSNSIISKNFGRKGKKLWTSGEAGELITLYSAMDESSEADFVANEIKKLVDSKKYSYKDIACFYRTNAQSRALEEALMSKKIFYKIFGTLKFWDRKEIKDIVAYLRLVVNNDDNQAFIRVVNTPTRGIGLQTVTNIINEANSTGKSLYEIAKKSDNAKIQMFVGLIEKIKNRANDVSLSKLVEFIYEESTYKQRLETSKDVLDAEGRIENIKELITYAGTVSNGIADHQVALDFFMDKVALMGGDDAFDSKNVTEENANNAVSLMTVHLAKGLEFPVVFFTGLEEGLVPHSRSIDNPEEIEEERRLCYVGMTRAMKKLYLSYAERRSSFQKNWDEPSFKSPSRFLRDIPSKYIQRECSNNTDDFNDLYKYSEHKKFKTSKFGSNGKDNGGFFEGYSDNYSKYAKDDYVNYDDESNYSFLPPMLKKRLLKKKHEKAKFGVGDALKSLYTANDMPEKIGNFRKLSLEEVKVGLKVRHPNFGDGIIRDIQGKGTTGNLCAVKLCIDFDNLPEQKKIILGKATFEIIE